ncbi:MAG: GYDIA family GHMP kinase [Bacteroidota bacterium]|nr:GYDIA family GHMP kinase [Bacteroidota bacterium]
MMKFHSNGKFLITGEYMVLYGARALAIPLRSGQSMLIEESEQKNLIEWTVSDIRGKWFQASLSLPDFNILETTDHSKGLFLQKVLLAARELNPHFLSSDQGYWVDNLIEFERNWGMGSSSSFIANLSQWARVDPLDIHKRISSGSGYDIACALSEKPIIFHKTFEGHTIDKINWVPTYRKHMAFIYLGKKQDTNDSLEEFKHLDFKDQDLKRISGITDEFWLVNNEIDSISRIWEHEEIMARILKQSPIQDKLFRDFNGAVKSLGAWGGDFVLAVGKQKFKKIRKYFQSKGFNTILSWDDLIIEN